MLAAAESALNRYLAEYADGVDAHALPGHVEKLAALAMKLQAGADTEPSPRASDLDKRKAEAEKLRSALDAKAKSA